MIRRRHPTILAGLALAAIPLFAPSGGISQQVAESADATGPGEFKNVGEFTRAVLSIDPDIEYGEYLAGECMTCHQASGDVDGIPSIVGLPGDYFVAAMFEYLTDVRGNEVMKVQVQDLTREQMAALAAYFSSLEPS